ncbi:MAG: hypothetical protein M0027_11130 [Candidatus Dormibacteraeota bacterium]|nr:hypothetical protein [Candidatus Dormibacteraeota bacterium]
MSVYELKSLAIHVPHAEITVELGSQPSAGEAGVTDPADPTTV